jgi:hypothetical protein
MTALGVLFEVLCVCGCACLVLAVSLALAVLPNRRRLARQVALATVGVVLGLFAAQGVTTLVVLGGAAVAQQVARWLGYEAGPEAVIGLLALALIGVTTSIAAFDGARAGWRIGGGSQFRAALGDTLLVRAIRRKRGGEPSVPAAGA